MDAATVAETTVASLEGLSVPIVIVDVLKGHCFFILGGDGCFEDLSGKDFVVFIDGAFKNLSAEPII